MFNIACAGWDKGVIAESSTLWKTAFPAKYERSLSKKQGQLISKCGKAANVNQLPTATNQHRGGTGQSKNKRSKIKYGSIKAFSPWN